MLTLPTNIESVMTLEVTATNKTKSAVKAIKITCNKVPLPVVTIVSPASETSVLNNCSTTIKAEVINITAKDQVSVSVNGNILNAATYTLSANILSIPLSVTDQMSVVITATNVMGTASDKTTLICNVSQVVTGPTTNSCNISSSPITNCTTCNDNSIVTGGDITVDQNKKICITNNFNGNVNMNGGQLVICGNATIHTINFNSGDIVVTGNASFDNINMNNTASAIRNYGTVQFSNITFNGRFENHGQATVRSDFNVNSSAVFINTGTLNATMSFNNNNFVCNSGTILVGSNYKDNGSAEFSNSCKLVVSGQINIDHIFNNTGAVSTTSMTYVNGSGKLTMGANAKWITDGLTVNGTIIGPSQSCASISVSNKTILNGSSSLSGKIDLCDVNGIDLKVGSIASSVTYDCSCAINMAGNCGLNDDLSEQVTICHNPAGSTDVPQTITISRSILSAHLAHGDHLGACTDADKPVQQTPVTTPVVVPPVTTQPTTEERITICHKPPGDPANVQTITIAKSALSAHLAHGDHVGACTDTDKPVTPTPTTPDVPVVTPTPTEQTPQQEERITICHKPPGNSSIVQTITVAKSALSAHLAHGDHVGACTDADMPVTQTSTPDAPIVTPTPTGSTPQQEERITICHRPTGSSIVQTITVAKSALSAHLAHGDHVGACTDADKPTTQTSTPDVPIVTPTPTEQTPQQEERITICHKPPGNSSIVQTITVAKSALSAHLAHGDHVGSCTDADKPVTQTSTPDAPGTSSPPQQIPQQEERITICHRPTGSSIVQTITIAKSALAIHLAHGDHVGGCTDADRGITQTPNPQTPVGVPPVTQTPQPQQEERITICHKPTGSSIVQTITIAKSALSIHLAHGDHIGGCTDSDRPVVQPTTEPTTPVVVPPVTQTPQPQQEERVTICHKPTGSSIVQTITIAKSMLNMHLAHGDHIGGCTDADRPVVEPTPTPVQTMVTICHKLDGQVQTLTIPQSELQKHMAHGDHVGVCTPDEVTQ